MPFADRLLISVSSDVSHFLSVVPSFLLNTHGQNLAHGASLFSFLAFFCGWA